MARKPVETEQTPAADVEPDTGEVVSGVHAIATRGEFGRATESGGLPPGLEVASYISVPMLTPEEVPPGVPFICRIVDAARVLPPIEGARRKIKGDHIASTIMAGNGDVRLFTWSAVFSSEMEKAYGANGELNGGYVGKWFRIVRLKKTGKDYWTFSITELRETRAAA